MAGRCQCLSDGTLKVKGGGSAYVATSLVKRDTMSLIRSSQGFEVPLDSTCPLPSCPPCPTKSIGLTQLYVLKEGGAGWKVACRLIQENGVWKTSLEEKEVESLEIEELINFGDEERVRREVALETKQVKLEGGKEVKDYYLQDCEDGDQWCKIVPYLLNIEAETAELGQGRKMRKEDKQTKEGAPGEVIVEEKLASSREERIKIVHFHHNHSWTPFLTILGVFFVVMAGFVLVTSLVIRKLNRVSPPSKLMLSQSCSRNWIRNEDGVCPRKLEFVKDVTIARLVCMRRTWIRLSSYWGNLTLVVPESLMSLSSDGAE